MNKNLLAAIRGYIRNGMNNYEIVGLTGLTWDEIEAVRKSLVIMDAIKEGKKVNIKWKKNV